MLVVHTLFAVALATGENPFVAIIQKITDSIKPAIVPSAILGLTFFLFFQFLAPFLPEGVMNMKGYFMKAALALVAFSMLSGLVTWLSTLAA